MREAKGGIRLVLPRDKIRSLARSFDLQSNLI